MSLTQITKEEYDKLFEEMLEATAQNLLDLSRGYAKAIEIRQKYSKDYKTYRVTHYLSDEGTIIYKKGARRNMGFKGGK